MRYSHHGRRRGGSAQEETSQRSCEKLEDEKVKNTRGPGVVKSTSMFRTSDHTTFKDLKGGEKIE
ncbi:hypothetical protein AKJ37_06165 [candidate division MSBL1 archaeon SCGC-AAA259I09]|uniref:Uncharacterized protein n=1 Tax=candidate division MSBL1 archaeon SCGC-AAA259I09 TaxID=1698267 RepID=A0A133UPC2_9EURY|nr:hypothetical protein AKJ37_06165 [candidate division MSBL1 archaeon SCGC-AAA259I09]